MEPTDTIDAVTMTRSIREKHAEQLRGATPEERIRFYREKAARLDGEMARQRRENVVTAQRSDVRG